jgi:transposase
MLSLPRSVRVYVGSETIDLRRGHDGLFALVKSLFDRDPYSGHLFVFFGRRRNGVKILFWDRGGFVLFYKRLERGRFAAIRTSAMSPSASHVEMDGTQLAMLLDGIDVRSVRRPSAWQPPIPMDTRSRI